MSGFKGFKKFLKETTRQEAMDMLGLGTSFDAAELKAAYRKASSKYHPDKGGSTEDMQKVNNSYELLQKSVGAVGSLKDEIRSKMNDTHEKYRQLAPIIRDSLIDSFNMSAYTEYFNNLFNEEFKGTITGTSPSDAEIKRMEGANFSSSPSYSRVSIEWANKDNTKVFELSVTVSLSNVVGNSGLSSSDTTYPMGVSTHAYMDNRKVKITARDYTHTAKNEVFNKPESIFPKAKLIKKKLKFKKSDMITALTREVKAETFNDRFLIPVNDKGDFISVSRMVFNRQPAWSISGAFTRSGYRIIPSTNIKVGFYGFPETEETLEMFKAIQKMPDSQIDNFLKAARDSI